MKNKKKHIKIVTPIAILHILASISSTVGPDDF